MQPVAYNTSPACSTVSTRSLLLLDRLLGPQRTTNRGLRQQPVTHKSALTTCHAPARTPPPATPAPSAAAATQGLYSSDLPSGCGPCPAQNCKTCCSRVAHLHQKAVQQGVLCHRAWQIELCKKTKASVKFQQATSVNKTFATKESYTAAGHTQCSSM